MEKRMVDIEQQLRLVKRLLQDKVNQLREQVSFPYGESLLPGTLS